jgi:virginiamycin B lyase
MEKVYAEPRPEAAITSRRDKLLRSAWPRNTGKLNSMPGRPIHATTLLAALLCAAAALPVLGQSADPLPAGPGHDTVKSVCSGCHSLSLITGARLDRASWEYEVGRMVKFGTPVTAANREEVVSYLATHFPAAPRPPGVVIPGPVKVAFQEWDAPTAGSFPHDPMSAHDGSLWWTGWIGNTLGRLDPKTGQIREFTPPIADSGPHGLVEDGQGYIWFTANTHAYIGRLDPATSEVKPFPMPDAAAKDPHTLQFDRQGIIWFTVQNANRVGRLDPKTGEIKLVTSPTLKSNPYGMVITSNGVPVFDEFGSHKIGTIDPKTLAIREYVLPNPATRPRRIGISSDDTIWYTDFSRGYLGRLDLKSGEVKEWASPSGQKSQPYAITVRKDVVWYVESNTAPNMLVRFDPKTEQFQSWGIPAGGGVVRNMVTMRDGRLGLAESALNKVAIATIQ